MKTLLLWLIISSTALAQTTAFSCNPTGGGGTPWGTAPCTWSNGGGIGGTSGFSSAASCGSGNCNQGGDVNVITAGASYQFWDSAAAQHAAVPWVWPHLLNVSNFTWTITYHFNKTFDWPGWATLSWAIGAPAVGYSYGTGASGENWLQLCCTGPTSGIVWAQTVAPCTTCSTVQAAWYQPAINQTTATGASGGSYDPPGPPTLARLQKTDGHGEAIGYPAWYVATPGFTPTTLNATDGDTFQLTITYDSQNLTQTWVDVTSGGSFTDTRRVQIANLIGSSTGYFGLASSSGTAQPTIVITNYSLVTGSPATPSTSTLHFSNIAQGARVQ